MAPTPIVQEVGSLRAQGWCKIKIKDCYWLCCIFTTYLRISWLLL